MQNTPVSLPLKRDALNHHFTPRRVQRVPVLLLLFEDDSGRSGPHQGMCGDRGEDLEEAGMHDIRRTQGRSTQSMLVCLYIYIYMYNIYYIKGFIKSSDR